MLLGLDLGTTNVKVLVTDDAGRPLAHGACPVQLFHVGAGGVEQDINEIWTATLSAVREAMRSIKPSDVRAIGVSSQGGAMQILDANRRPIGRVISWLDQRGQTDGAALTAKLGRKWFAQRIGHERAWLAAGQLLRLRRESSGAMAAPHRIGFVGDIIVERLCGHAAHDGTSASLTLLYNPTSRSYDPDLLERLGISAGQLPDLLSPRLAAGGLLHEVANQVGLSAGIPVSAAVHDQYAAALGSNAARSGSVMIGAGTAWVLLAVTDRWLEPVSDSAFVCHHVVAGLFGQILSLVNGGSAVTWTLDLMGLREKSAAEIETLLEHVPAGADGLCFWPFLTPFGASGLVPGTKGRLSGLQFLHRPAHVVRAVVEGLAFELKRHLMILERAAIPVERLILSGGVAAGRATPQIIADVGGLPLACSNAGEGSLLGAAVLARGLLEPRRSLADLAAEMAGAPREIEPGPDASFYAARFEEYKRALPLRQENQE